MCLCVCVSPTVHVCVCVWTVPIVWRFCCSCCWRWRRLSLVACRYQQGSRVKNNDSSSRRYKTKQNKTKQNKLLHVRTAYARQAVTLCGRKWNWKGIKLNSFLCTSSEFLHSCQAQPSGTSAFHGGLSNDRIYPSTGGEANRLSGRKVHQAKRLKSQVASWNMPQLFDLPAGQTEGDVARANEGSTKWKSKHFGCCCLPAQSTWGWLGEGR